MPLSLTRTTTTTKRKLTYDVRIHPENILHYQCVVDTTSTGSEKAIFSLLLPYLHSVQFNKPSHTSNLKSM